MRVASDAVDGAITVAYHGVLIVSTDLIDMLKLPINQNTEDYSTSLTCIVVVFEAVLYTARFQASAFNSPLKVVLVQDSVRC